MSRDEASTRRLWSARAALATFVTVELLALVLRLHWARGEWFTLDDWDFLELRRLGDVGDLFRPHAGHWSTVIVVVYRLLWGSYGARYLPFAMFALALYLAVAMLVRVVMRRAGVAPWVATLTASLLVLFGGGIENNFFTAVLFFSLIQLLLADHQGAVDWRDGAALAAGLLALMCSGLAVTSTIVVGLAMLLRRGWRIALLHTVPLGAIYVVWSLSAPPSHDTAFVHGATLDSVSRFMIYGAGTGFGRLGALAGVGIVLALALAAGVILIWRTEGHTAVTGRAAPPLAMLAGAIIFLFLTGAARSGSAVKVLAAGPERARDPRYTYVIAAMTLPALAMAVDALIRRWRVLSIVAAVVLIGTVPTRVHQFRDAAKAFGFQGSVNHSVVLSAAASPLASQLPRSLPVSSGVFGGNILTIGFLVDGVRAGRFPPPKGISPAQIATESLSLALLPRAPGHGNACVELTRPTVRVLEKGDELTLKNGDAEVVYEASPGVNSSPYALASGTVRALAGPLRLQIFPAPSHTARQTVMCATTGS